MVLMQDSDHDVPGIYKFPRVGVRLDTGQHLNLGGIRPIWEAIDTCHERYVETLNGTDFSGTPYFDESQDRSKLRAYLVADRLLGFALDNHWALQNLLFCHGATHAAPWSLLRPAFECGFLAAWVLDPSDSVERIKRALRVDAHDYDELRKYANTLAEVPGESRGAEEIIASISAETGDELKELVASFGMEWDQAKAGVAVMNEIQNLALLDSDSSGISMSLTKLAWRLVSGLEHGHAYALQQGSSVFVTSESSTKIEQMVGLGEGAFTMCCQATGQMIVQALTRSVLLRTQTA